MNKLLQASLVATLMSAGSTALYAEGDTASRPSYNWGNCTSIGCEKDIPIKLEIPKKCEVLGGTAINLNKNGGTQSSNYSCNEVYLLQHYIHSNQIVIVYWSP